MIGALRGKKQTGEERSNQERKIQSLWVGEGWILNINCLLSQHCLFKYILSASSHKVFIQQVNKYVTN